MCITTKYTRTFLLLVTRGAYGKCALASYSVAKYGLCMLECGCRLHVCLGICEVQGPSRSMS